MHTDEDFALLTYLLTYYVMYSSSSSQKFLEWSKQQCHHATTIEQVIHSCHRISMCVIVYITEVLSLSPFDTWLSLRELKQNVLTHLTYLLTYSLHRTVKILSPINCLCLSASPYVH